MFPTSARPNETRGDSGEWTSGGSETEGRSHGYANEPFQDAATCSEDLRRGIPHPHPAPLLVISGEVEVGQRLKLLRTPSFSTGGISFSTR